MKIRQAHISNINEPKQLREKRVVLPNGLSASIVGLEDQSVADVAALCNHVVYISHPNDLTNYAVLTIIVHDCPIHFIYRGWGWGSRKTYVFNLLSILRQGQFEVLEKACIIVCSNTLHENEACMATIFRYAVQHNVSPQIATLIAQKTTNKV